VAFAEGVVHLDDDGAQRAVGAVAVPEAHRLEGVAQHARIAVQPGLAVGVGDAFGAQQLVQPFQRVHAAVAMVGIPEAERAGRLCGSAVGPPACRLRIGSSRKKVG
jgi:hypothetical protein